MYFNLGLSGAQADTQWIAKMFADNKGKNRMKEKSELESNMGPSSGIWMGLEDEDGILGSCGDSEEKAVACCMWRMVAWRGWKQFCRSGR